MIKEEEEVVCEADDAVEEAGDEREQDPEPDPIGLEDEDGVEEDFQLGRYIMCWDLLNLYKLFWCLLYIFTKLYSTPYAGVLLCLIS